MTTTHVHRAFFFDKFSNCMNCTHCMSESTYNGLGLMKWVALFLLLVQLAFSMCIDLKCSGRGVANRIWNANIPGSNPTTDCVRFLCGLNCCTVQKAIADYSTYTCQVITDSHQYTGSDCIVHEEVQHLCLGSFWKTWTYGAFECAEIFFNIYQLYL